MWMFFQFQNRAVLWVTILPPAEASEATKVEEMLTDSGFLGSSFLESERGIPLLPVL